MKTLDKFILKSYLGPMILTFFIVMFVLLMNFMWRYIDDLVGKGLDVGVIAELLMYGTITMIPMGLPLATLLAAIMTLGNMGENYELQAMKSAGVSLPRIIRPLILVVALVAVGSFFIANNLVPYAARQMSALLFDIRQQKQTIEFKDGLFFNGLPDMSIRIEKQHPETGLLTDVLIYDNRSSGGNMSSTIADSGYIRLSDDKRNLLVTLFQGESVEHTRNYQWLTKNDLRRSFFEKQELVMPSSGFAMDRSNANMFTGGSQSKNIVQLERGIDSMNVILINSSVESYRPFLTYLFSNNQALVVDSLRATDTHKHRVYINDSIAKIGPHERLRIWNQAVSTARSSQNSFSMEEDMSKETLNQFYRFRVEWHRKLSLPISIMIFFLIGAPLGAIIRKGGLGLPIVISVIFFVIYYIISLTGEKMAREGTWLSYQGMWLSTFILAPIAIFLVYKATNDSNLFNAERYIVLYHKVRDEVKKVYKKMKKKDKNDVEKSIK